MNPIDRDLFNNIHSIGEGFGKDRTGLNMQQQSANRSINWKPKSQSNIENLLAKLYQHLIQPIIEYLPEEGNYYLLFEPHLLLWAVPFAALKAPDGSYLCDKYSFVVSPSMQLNQVIQGEERITQIHTASALIMGNPDFSEFSLSHGEGSIMFNPLPGAEAEALSIANMFSTNQCKLFIGQEATEETFLEHANSANIIHLATHGYSDESKPEESFLVFKSNLLQAKEIQNLLLIADLVVLSACQTGLGKITGDGVVGMSRSFLIAGARSVLVSLWRISDSATAEIMKSFYHFYHKGQTKAEALRNAMLTLRKNPQYSHPRYWSGFYLVGVDQ